MASLVTYIESRNGMPFYIYRENENPGLYWFGRGIQKHTCDIPSKALYGEIP